MLEEVVACHSNRFKISWRSYARTCLDALKELASWRYNDLATRDDVYGANGVPLFA